MALKTHFGDPCIHCRIPHDEVPPGPCSGQSSEAVPIACRFLETRRDGARHFLVRMSDGRVEDVWQSRAENPFGVNDLPIDESITW